MSSMQCSDTFLVYITFPEHKEAQELAYYLVSSGCAAGVNIVPVMQSIYFWQGAVRERKECLLFAQVAASSFEQFQEVVRNAHPDLVPCIIALPIVQGFPAFLDWIATQGRAQSFEVPQS